MNIIPNDYFNASRLFQTETIHFESREKLVYVTHENGEKALLAEDIQRTAEVCHAMEEDLLNLSREIKKNTSFNSKDRIQSDIRMILRNQGTILTFYNFVLTQSPCDLNVFRGIEEIVEEFTYVGDKRYPSYFLPEELTNQDPNEGTAVVLKDGSQACVYSIGSKSKYYDVLSFLEDLQSHSVQVQGPSYIVRSPYQMMLTMLKHICENKLILRKCSCCGEVFQALHASRKYCSRQCSDKRREENTKESQAKEDVKALKNFKQTVSSRFRRYCQGKTKNFFISLLKIPEENGELIQEFDRAVTQRDQALFYNTLDNLIQQQKERLQSEQYVQWLETAGRKRKSYGNCRDSEK